MLLEFTRAELGPRAWPDFCTKPHGALGTSPVNQGGDSLGETKLKLPPVDLLPSPAPGSPPNALHRALPEEQRRPQLFQHFSVRGTTVAGQSLSEQIQQLFAVECNSLPPPSVLVSKRRKGTEKKIGEKSHTKPHNLPTPALKSVWKCYEHKEGKGEPPAVPDNWDSRSEGRGCEIRTQKKEVRE